MHASKFQQARKCLSCLKLDWSELLPKKWNLIFSWSHLHNILLLVKNTTLLPRLLRDRAVHLVLLLMVITENESDYCMESHDSINIHALCISPIQHETQIWLYGNNHIVRRQFCHGGEGRRVAQPQRNTPLSSALVVKEQKQRTTPRKSSVGQDTHGCGNAHHHTSPEQREQQGARVKVVVPETDGYTWGGKYRENDPLPAWEDSALPVKSRTIKYERSSSKGQGGQRLPFYLRIFDREWRKSKSGMERQRKTKRHSGLSGETFAANDCKFNSFASLSSNPPSPNSIGFWGSRSPSQQVKTILPTHFQFKVTSTSTSHPPSSLWIPRLLPSSTLTHTQSPLSTTLQEVHCNEHTEDDGLTHLDNISASMEKSMSNKGKATGKLSPGLLTLSNDSALQSTHPAP